MTPKSQALKAASIVLHFQWVETRCPLRRLRFAIVILKRRENRTLQ
jgi:hypothetical protein